MRPFVLRPTPLDHPNFTGSNPAYAAALATAATGTDTAALVRTLLQGPWDVDNDGDGIMDSVWLDLGLPVATTSDGRLYRPLFAFLCTDLDGRLNLNVHGTRDQVVLLAQGGSITASDMVAGNGGGTLLPPRGLGYGPPEINLGTVFTMANCASLLDGRYAQRVQTSTTPVPGGTGVDAFGLLSTDLPQDYESLVRLPTDGQLPDLGVYASPGDIGGSGVVVLDHAGQPMFIDMGQDQQRQLVARYENPYELNADEATQWDTLYTVGDLERLLRRNDLDANILSRRLLTAAPVALSPDPTNVNQFNQVSQLVTTHSFSLPVPGVQLPPPCVRCRCWITITVRWRRSLRPRFWI